MIFIGVFLERTPRIFGDIVAETGPREGRQCALSGSRTAGALEAPKGATQVVVVFEGSVDERRIDPLVRKVCPNSCGRPESLRRTSHTGFGESSIVDVTERLGLIEGSNDGLGGRETIQLSAQLRA